MSPRRRRLSHIVTWLTWFALGGGMALAVGCGPALTSQVQLNEMGTRARADCQAQQRRKKCEIDPGSVECGRATVRCFDALKCAEAVQASVEETQRVQLRRATVGATSAEEAVVQLKYDSAVLVCRPYHLEAALPPTDPLPRPAPAVRAPVPPTVPAAPVAPVAPVSAPAPVPNAPNPASAAPVGH